ncbi:MAG: hypothetical protein IJ678_09535 [Kiritimatiellae bacterium]|nr:hypothetical protein [Kiritimatiellia bacterium]
MPTAAEEILRKAILPTALSSREMRETIGAGVLRRSIASARTAEAPYLARLQELLAEFAEGRSNRADFVKAAQDTPLSRKIRDKFSRIFIFARQTLAKIVFSRNKKKGETFFRIPP